MDTKIDFTINPPFRHQGQNFPSYTYDYTWFRHNISNYKNINFESTIWPYSNNLMYGDYDILKYMCDNIIDINASQHPNNISKYDLFCKVHEHHKMINENYFMSAKKDIILAYIINSGYYIKLSKSRFLCKTDYTDIKSCYGKVIRLQQWLHNLTGTYTFRNTIKYYNKIHLLLWLMKYQKIIPNVLIKHKILVSVYS